MKTERMFGIFGKALRAGLAAVLCLSFMPASVFALGTDWASYVALRDYFLAEYNHGTQTATCAEADENNVIYLEVGETATVTVNPYQHVQYTGCRMWGKCPEVCSEYTDDCFVSGKGCKCDRTLVLVTATVDVSLSKQIVATSSVVADSTISTSSGVGATNTAHFTVTAVSEGEATMSVALDGMYFWLYSTVEFTVVVGGDDADDPADPGDSEDPGDDSEDPGDDEGDDSEDPEDPGDDEGDDSEDPEDPSSGDDADDPADPGTSGGDGDDGSGEDAKGSDDSGDNGESGGSSGSGDSGDSGSSSGSGDSGSSSGSDDSGSSSGSDDSGSSSGSGDTGGDTGSSGDTGGSGSSGDTSGSGDSGNTGNEGSGGDQSGDTGGSGDTGDTGGSGDGNTGDGNTGDDEADDPVVKITYDLGLYTPAGYSTVSTDMGKNPAGKTSFIIYPDSDVLATYQEENPSATIKSMLSDWVASITSVSIDGQVLSAKAFDEWKAELTNAAADSEQLFYYDTSVYTRYVSLVLPVALFETDHAANQYCTRTVSIEADGFASFTTDVTYRNLGSDSLTVRVLDTDGNVLYTCSLTESQLRALNLQEGYRTAANCGMAGLRAYSSRGVLLSEVFAAAGVSFGEGMTLKLRCNDELDENGSAETTEEGYIANGTFTYETLMAERYYYPAMWDDTTVYEELDGQTIYQVLSTDMDAWKEGGQYADVLPALLGASKVACEPIVALEWSEGVVAWGGSDPSTLDYSGYSDQLNYRFSFGMLADENGAIADDNTTFSNVYALFGIDIIADESAILGFDDGSGSGDGSGTGEDVGTGEGTGSGSDEGTGEGTSSSEGSGSESGEAAEGGSTGSGAGATSGNASSASNNSSTSTKLAKVKGVRATSKKAKRATITWKKVQGATGYQIRYRQKGTKKWKIITVKGTSKVLKKLKRGKTYQVKVRAKGGTWSKVVKVKIK